MTERDDSSNLTPNLAFKNILNGFERNNCISCFYDKSESLIIRSAALISMNLGWILDSSAE